MHYTAFKPCQLRQQYREKVSLTQQSELRYLLSPSLWNFPDFSNVLQAFRAKSAQDLTVPDCS